MDKLKKKKNGQKAGRTGRGFTLFISNGDMDDVIKIVESWEKSGIVIDGAIETVNHEIKKKISFCYDGTYGSFIDSTNGFFINVTYTFFINKLYIWKRTRRWVSSIVSTTFNDESIVKRS